MFTTDFTEVEQGRIIAALRAKKTRGSWRWDSTTRRYDIKRPRRLISDEDICKLLDITPAQLKELGPQRLMQWSYDDDGKWIGSTGTDHPKKRRQKMAKAYLDFAKKNERWPTKDDKAGVNGIPHQSTIRRHGFNEGQIYQEVVNSYFKELTPELIMAIPNMTVRRDAMEKYGIDKLLKKQGTLLQQDDFGKLWELPADNPKDDKSVYVEVLNSTAEPDGTFSRYFLRVPPETQTAQAASAWTFDHPEEQYQIAAQT